MLHLLDESLAGFLRAEVPLVGGQVDIGFEAPDQDWGSRVTRPTINLFLWDIRQNLDERQAGNELVEEDGRRWWRAPRPRIDCHYLVTAWTGDVGDEHQLLGAVLVAFLGHGELPLEHLAGALGDLRPLPSVTVAGQREQTTSMDFWSAVGGRLKPGLELVVTSTIDVGVLSDAGPLVHQYQLVLKDSESGAVAGGARLVGGHIEQVGAAGLVVSPSGSTAVRTPGSFVVRGEAGDPIEFVPQDDSVEESGVVEESGPVATNRRKKRGRKRAQS